MPKKLKIFSLKIYKGAGIFKIQIKIKFQMINKKYY